MAQDVTVNLGSFSLSSYLDKNFVLAVSTSMLIFLPDQYSGILTAEELRRQVQAGSLWITRAGSCHIELSICFEGSFEGASRKQLQPMVIEAFENFPVWDALGLDIRREYNQFSELRGSRSLYPYSVQHNQQNSSLIAPAQVPCAYLSTLTCNFTFRPRSTLVGRLQSEATAEPEDPGIIALCISPRKLQGMAAMKRHSDSPPAKSPPLPRKTKIVTLRIPPSGLRRILGIPEIYSLSPKVQEQRLEHLTHTALHLVFGSRKRCSGIQLLEKPSAPPALDVAPAVWNSRYFQDVVSRAQLVPFISSALGNLMSTESPHLRHKIQNLGIDPLQEMHVQTLLLVLRSTRVPKVQVQVQRISFQPQDPADSVVEDDRLYDLSESQAKIQEQEPPGAEYDDRPHNGIFSCVGVEMDARDDNDSDVALDDGRLWRNNTGVDDELFTDLGVPYSDNDVLASRSSPEDFQEPRMSDTDSLPDGRAFQEGAIYETQRDGDQEEHNHLNFDARDEEYVEDVNVYWAEDSDRLAHQNFEQELFNNRFSSDDTMGDTQLYNDDGHDEQYHQAYLGTEPEWDDESAYQQCFHKLDDTGGLEDGFSDVVYWTQQDFMMDSGDIGFQHGLELPGRDVTTLPWTSGTIHTASDT